MRKPPAAVSSEVTPSPRLNTKNPEWSPRQLRSSGLNRRFYGRARELVDYDYDATLPDDARVWLAAFTEEHYRGWRLKSEEQVHPLPALRAADAARKRAERAQATTEPVQMLGMDAVAALEARAPTEDDLVEAMDRQRAALRGKERRRWRR
jgi:hypothetical protein